MAYKNYENHLINSFSNDIKSKKIDPVIHDLEKPKALQKYNNYINEVVKLDPREFNKDSVQIIDEKVFFDVFINIALEIFGDDAYDKIMGLSGHIFTSGTNEMLDGIALEKIDLKNPSNIERFIEIPDAKHVSSIITLLHEFTHHYLQLTKVDFNKNRYHNEILSLYVEKIATEKLAKMLKSKTLEQKVAETRLEIVKWHNYTHKKEMQTYLAGFNNLKRLAETNIKYRFIVEEIEKEIPWMKTNYGIYTEELYRKNLAAAYGLGYLYAESLLAKYKEDESLTTKKFIDVMNGNIKLADLLKYYNINATSDNVYETVNKTLKKVKDNKSIISK